MSWLSGKLRKWVWKQSNGTKEQKWIFLQSFYRVVWLACVCVCVCKVRELGKVLLHTAFSFMHSNYEHIYLWLGFWIVLKNSPKFMVAAPHLKDKLNRSAPTSVFLNLELLDVLGSTYQNSLLAWHLLGEHCPTILGQDLLKSLCGRLREHLPSSAEINPPNI